MVDETLIYEGKAKIKVDPGVFYNAKMIKLRDLSVCFVSALGNTNKKKLIDTTSATGIRGIRYALECQIDDITMLDINKKAYENTKHNLKLNEITAHAENKSIQEFTNLTREKFDIIDLDPFGTPAPYIYDLMKVAMDKSVIMVTATDTAVLCGAHSSACIKTYASVPLHNELCHEVGTRILINYIARIAAQFNFGIKPLLAVAEMHYIRVFIKLQHGASNVKSTLKDVGFGSYCNTCHNFALSFGIAPHTVTKCSYCNSDMHVFGPLWLGKLYDKSLAERMLKYAQSNKIVEVEKTINEIIKEEDIPLFYHLPTLTKYLKIGSVQKEKVLNALSMKFRASRTHFDADAIKTDAPIGEVYRCVSFASPSNDSA